VKLRERLTPYVLLGVLTLGVGLGVGLGLSEAPSNAYVWVAYAPLSSAPYASVSPALSPPIVTTPPPTTTTTVPYVAASVRCQVAQLSLGEGAPISPATGQRPILLTLTNEGSTACYMVGYPGISLYDVQGRLLPLTYQWAGDQMVTSGPPSRVGLAPGGTAYVLINKYRCDLGDLDVAATLRLIPPDDTSPLTLNLQGLGSEESCVPGADGVTLAISPVEASVQATLQG
jgi:hypothetical protein